MPDAPVHPFDKPALKQFYVLISKSPGVHIAELTAMLSDAAARPMSEIDLSALREGKGPWKKLIDEVWPVAQWLMREGVSGHVRFSLSDASPDAWFMADGAEAPVGIEVTRVLGRARSELARDLGEGEIGRGFIDLPEDAPQARFDKARSRRRMTHVRTSVEHLIEASVRERLQKKFDPKFQGHILLLLAPMHSAPAHNWEAMIGRLKQAMGSSPFARIVVMDDSSRRHPTLEL